MKKDGLALEPDVYALLTTTPNAPAKSINHTTDLKRYLLGTKNKKLIRNSGGSLTLYTGARSPGGERKRTGCQRRWKILGSTSEAYWGGADSGRFLAATEEREGQPSRRSVMTTKVADLIVKSA